MTHNELLVLLNAKSDSNEVHALRAIVELHKPMSNREPFCNECRGVHQGEIDIVVYPCHTIRAIEKELK